MVRRAPRRLVEVAGAEPDDARRVALSASTCGGAPPAVARGRARRRDRAGAGRTTTSPGVSALDRLGDPPARGAAPAPFGVQRGAEPAVLVDVAGAAAEPYAMAGERLAAALQLPFEPDDVPVGLELRERQVQEVVRDSAGYRCTRFAAML